MPSINRNNVLSRCGASVPAGLKDVVTVIPDLLNWFNEKQSAFPNNMDCINEIIKIIQIWYETKKEKKSVDIETLLEIIERLEVSFNDIVPEFFKDNDLKLESNCIEILRKRTLSNAIKVFIQRKFQEFDTFDYYKPLERFLSNYRPISIFTTNYDPIIEQFCYFHSPRFKYYRFFYAY